MKKYSIRNSLGWEVGQVETSYDEDFAVCLYASQFRAPIRELRRIGYKAELICILL